MARPRVFDQASWRRSVVMRDQHGRKWGFTIDTKTMSPVASGIWVDWSPSELPGGKRLIPPQKYLRFDPEDLGTVVIDYDSWKADLERADETWESILQAHATGMYGDKAAEAMERPPVPLLRMVGPRPFPLALVVACEQGDPWALGLEVKKDARGKSVWHKVPAELQPVVNQMKPYRTHEAEAVAAAAKPAT